MVQLNGSTIAIPFNRPSLVGNEMGYFAEAIANGHLSGDGPFTRRCQVLLESSLDVEKVLLTTSCTHALEMVAILLDIRPDDEVIVPSFTFVSTMNAFVVRGARPVFCDIRPDTLNLDESKLEALITPRTKAVVVVHYAGVGCEMEAIERIARRHGVPVIEDNAHGLFGKYRGRHLGTFGPLATVSFHETKNFSCGEGGALLINDPALIERAEIVREKGTDRSRFYRGEVDKYTWLDIGSSYVPADGLAAFLLAQLESREEIQTRRREIWHEYEQALLPWANDQGIGLPNIPAHCEQTFHIFHLMMPSSDARHALIQHLRARSILAVSHYQPLHRSPMGRQSALRESVCPVSEAAGDRLLRLPFYNSLTRSDQERVIEAVVEFRTEELNPSRTVPTSREGS